VFPSGVVILLRGDVKTGALKYDLLELGRLAAQQALFFSFFFGKVRSTPLIFNFSQLHP
jgi:hypothetical protein